MTSLRDDLRQAHNARARAQDHLERVGASLGRAQKVLEEVVRDAEAHDAAERREAEARTDELMRVIVSGSPLPKFDERSSEKHGGMRAADAVRRASTERVVAELRREEVEAERVLERVEQDVALNVRRILMQEAQKIADRWAAIDAEALALRGRLGRPYGEVARLGGLDGHVGRAVLLNNDDPLSLEENSAVSSVWVSLAAALASDAEARPDFVAVDRVRARLKAEAEEHRAAVDIITERMRALGVAQ